MLTITRLITSASLNNRVTSRSLRLFTTSVKTFQQPTTNTSVPVLFNSFDELISLLRVKFFYKLPQPRQVKQQADVSFCYDILQLVSRSFAIVIQELPDELRDPICVFYLVLRALDTVEDDMSYPRDKKMVLLRHFYSKLDQQEFTIQDCKSY